MAIYFISDLHLRGDQPSLLQLFEKFINQLTDDAEAVYILGDLFEVWLGDDMVLPDYQPALKALHRLTQRGVPVYVMYGNRDFLMREQFCQQTGASLLADPSLINLFGVPTVLLHGDTLCTDDVRYQQFRAMVRNPAFQNSFLAKTPTERLAVVKEYRQMSVAETSNKSMDIMDVNLQTVVKVLQQQQVYQMIHGHTHRPAIHEVPVDGTMAKRIVLSDWHADRGNYLKCTPSGCELHYFTC